MAIKNLRLSLLFTALVALAGIQQANGDVAMFVENFDNTGVSDTVVSSSNLVTVGGDTAVSTTTLFTGNNGFAFDAANDNVDITSIGNSRSVGFFIDLAGTSAGSYDVDFNLSAFTGTGGGAFVGAEVFEFSGLTGTAAEGGTFDLHVGNDATGLDIFSNTITGLGATTVASLGRVEFTGTGDSTINIALGDSVAVDGDFLFVLAGRNSDQTNSVANGVNSAGAFTLDSVSITEVAVPEPASAAILALSLAGLACVRRKRS